MLANVLLRLKEEVAMDGDKGTSINDAWTYVERFLVEEFKNNNNNSSSRKNNNNNNNNDFFTTTTTTMPVVDSPYKKYFWSHFRYLPDLSFFIKDQSFATMEQQQQQQLLNKPATVGEGGVGPEYNLIEGLTQMDYDQVESRYGSRLCVVADKGLQEAQLFSDIPIGQAWPANLRYYLSTILHAREAGITQAELTKVWNIDPRIAGHFVKKLEEKGAITRTMATINATRTNLCVHIRFKNRNHKLTDDRMSSNTNTLGVIFTRTLFRDRLTELLTDAKDNLMYADEILMELGFDLPSPKTRKWFARTVDYLSQDGLIRKLKAQSSGASRGKQYIQLTKFKSGSRLAQDWNDQMNHSIDKFGDLDPFVLKAKNENTHSSKLLDGVSVEYQILQLIRSAGDQGVTHKDIATALRCDNQRITTRSLDRLYESKQNENLSQRLERVLEFVGRNRRYRYYSHNAEHLKMEESNTIDNHNQFNLEEIDYHTLKPQTTNYIRNIKKKNQHSSTTADIRTNNRSANKGQSLTSIDGVVLLEQQYASASPTANTSSNITLVAKQSVVPTTDLTSLDYQPLNHENISSPTHIPIDAVLTNSFSTTIKDKSMQQINKYLEKRKQIVMALLEDENIIERGIGFTKLFLAKQSELFGDNGNRTYLIDGKTIWRSVMSLEKEGKLQICERHMSLLNGKTTTRQFLLKNGMDSNGPLVERYFELVDERRMLQPTMNNKGNTDMANIQVERLDNQLSRTRQFKPSTLSGGTTGLPEYTKNETSLEVGLKFGYVSCRMARTKLLHLYLLDTLASGTGVNRIGRRIPTTVLIYNMTLGFFCKAFGVSEYTNQLQDYMQDKSHQAVTLVELPNAIRGCIFPYLDRFRARLRVLLGYLLVLGLVEKDGDMGPTSENSPPALALAYKLTTKADIRNYRLPSHPILQEHTLLDLADALKYWNNLEYLCTKTNLEDGESATPLTNGHTNAKWIRSLYTQRNWSPSKVFSREQKSALDEHVDPSNQSTPLNHAAWCRSIALDLNVSVKSVRAYYRKFEVAMHRNSKRVQQENSPPLETTYGMKTIASETDLKYKDERIDLPLIQQSMMGQEGARHKRLLSNDDDILRRKYSRLSPQMASSLFSCKTWTSEDDDILKLCYVILNHRKECGARFIWKPMGKLLEKFSIRQGIRRLSIIREIPKHSEDLQNTRIRWHRYYNQGVTNRSLVSWEKTNGYDCDITPYVAYYLYSYQMDCENASPNIYPPLPTDVQALQQYYDLKYMAALNSHSYVFFEDIYHQKLSTAAIRRSIYSHPFTQRIHTTESYDHPPTQHISELGTNERIAKLLQEFFKMILLTPDELYDPFYAHAMMNNYPQSLLDMALERSQEEGVLVRTNTEHTTDRRIPKTSLVMSEKFLRNINMRLPAHIWSSAHEYEKHLISVTRTLLDPIELHGGMMVCILNLLSMGKLSINIPDFSGIVDRFVSPRYTARNIGEGILEYALSLEMVDHHHSYSCVKPNHQQEIKLLHGNIMKSNIYCDSPLDKKTSALVQQIVDYLHSRFDVGATLLELKQNIQSEQGFDTLPDKVFLASVDIITKQTNPPVAAFVGHDDPRLVLTSELQTWTILPRFNSDHHIEYATRQKHIPTPSNIPSSPTASSIPGSTVAFTPGSTIQSIPAPSINSEKANDPSQTTIPTEWEEAGRQIKRRKLDDTATLTSERKENSLQKQDKAIIPRLWIDIYGHRTECIWRKCVALVVEAILNRPGITFGHLRRIMMNKLSAVEIMELLRALLDWGAIRQLCVSVATSSPSLPKTKCGLFTSRHSLHTVLAPTIDPSVQTSYWLLPGYYNHLPLG